MRYSTFAGFRSGTTTYAVVEHGNPYPGRRTFVMLPLAHGKAITAVTLPKRPRPVFGQPVTRPRPRPWL